MYDTEGIRTERGRPLNRLIAASAVYVIFSVIATIIAISIDLPSTSGGPSERSVVLDFLIGPGTALNVSLGRLVGLGICTWYSRRRTRWAIGSASAVVLLSAWNIFSHLRGTQHLSAADTDIGVVASTVGIILSASVLIFAVQLLVERLAPRRLG